jgi:hypothetical protein
MGREKLNAALPGLEALAQQAIDDGGVPGPGWPSWSSTTARLLISRASAGARQASPTGWMPTPSSRSLRCRSRLPQRLGAEGGTRGPHGVSNHPVPAEHRPDPPGSGNPRHPLASDLQLRSGRESDSHHHRKAQQQRAGHAHAGAVRRAGCPRLLPRPRDLRTQPNNAKNQGLALGLMAINRQRNYRRAPSPSSAQQASKAATGSAAALIGRPITRALAPAAIAWAGVSTRA